MKARTKREEEEFPSFKELQDFKKTIENDKTFLLFPVFNNRKMSPMHDCNSLLKGVLTFLYHCIYFINIPKE